MSKSKNAAISVAVALIAAATAQAGILNSELVVNGDFETGDFSGWSNNGLEIVTPSVTGFGGLDDPSVIGSFSATGGPGPFIEIATQSFDLTSLAAQIDAGLIQYDLAALLQSRSGGANSDDAAVSLDFRNAADQSLSALSLIDPAVGITWDEYTFSSLVPFGTRSIELIISVSRVAGSSGDGYIDNVSLVLTQVPGPSAATALLLAVPAATRRRRHAVS